VLAAVLLGERLGTTGIAGGLLLGAALVLAARGEVARQERVRSA
jgi:drug/metabolite transporter (DMT)-like permease